MILRLGDRGLEVTRLQRFLILEGFLGYYVDADRGITPPEYLYGLKTKRAVIQLQDLLGLEPTGIFDSNMYEIYYYYLSTHGYSPAIDTNLAWSLGSVINPIATKIQNFNAKIQNSAKSLKAKVESAIAPITSAIDIKGTPFISIPKEGGKTNTIVDNAFGKFGLTISKISNQLNAIVKTTSSEQSIMDIAKGVLGNQSCWKDIQAMNRLPNGVITPGTEIKVPITEELEKKADKTVVVDEISIKLQNPSTPADRRRGKYFTQNEIEFIIINMNTGSDIKFGIAPETISDSINAVFSEQAVMGRSSPYEGYSSSGPRDISFTVPLYASYCPEGIIATERKLRALVYPSKSVGIQPPKCRFKIGAFIDVICVPKSISTTWKKPFIDETYMFADVTLTITVIEDNCRFAKEVELNG